MSEVTQLVMERGKFQYEQLDPEFLFFIGMMNHFPENFVLP